MKKFLSLFLVLSVLLMAVCAASADDFKVGVILVHDENSGYDQAHIEGVQGAMERLGLTADQVIFKYNIPESEECTDAAIDLAEHLAALLFVLIVVYRPVVELPMFLLAGECEKAHG